MTKTYQDGLNDGYIVAKLEEAKTKIKELLLRTLFPKEWIQHMDLPYHGGYCETCDAFYLRLQKLTHGDTSLSDEIDKLFKEVIGGRE